VAAPAATPVAEAGKLLEKMPGKLNFNQRGELAQKLLIG